MQTKSFLFWDKKTMLAYFIKKTDLNPNPSDVGVISMIVSHPQSEHLSLFTIVDFSGLDSNIFFNISIIVYDILK